MKCRKCGREADSSLTFCPSCGVRLKAGPDLEEITNEIAGKVDLFMSETEASKEGEGFDGIKMVDGEMVADEPEGKTETRRFAEEQTSDSVFDDISKSLNSEEKEEYTAPVDISGTQDEKAGLSRNASQYKDPSVTGCGTEPEKKNEKPKKTGLIAGIIILAVLAAGIIAGCFFVFNAAGKKEEAEETEAEEDVITCSAEDGLEYSAPLEITLESSLGYRLYYTLDGSTPSAKSTVYSGSITLSESYIDDAEGTEITLKVVSYSDASILSGEYEVTFTLVYAEIDSPEISPSSGNYSSSTFITITAVSGAKIYYTTDGTTPTEDSNLYTGQFEMERGNTVISAIAVKNGMSSAVTTAVYNLDIPSKYTFSEAADIILAYLISTGEVADEDGNLPSEDTSSSDSEESEDGEEETEGTGYVDFMDGGTCIIDNDQYIVVECYFYDAQGNETECRFYGVDDQTGNYYELSETGSGYTKQ